MRRRIRQRRRMRRTEREGDGGEGDEKRKEKKKKDKKRNSPSEHVLRKNHHCTSWPKNFSATFLGFYPKILHFISRKILMTFFSYPLFLGFYQKLFHFISLKYYSDDLF